MKKLQTVLTFAMTAVVLSATVLASTAAEKVNHPTAVAAVNPDIKKLLVTGNIRVFLVQSDREWVSLDQEDTGKVSVKQIGHTLTISSSEKSPVSVTVYVKDLYRVDASDQAVVKTIGKLNVKNLQIMLRDNATARIKANTESLYTVVNNHANLELLGATAIHIVKTDGIAIVNTNKLVAVTTNHEPQETEVAVNTMGRAKQGVRSNLKK